MTHAPSTRRQKISDWVAIGIFLVCGVWVWAMREPIHGLFSREEGAGGAAPDTRQPVMPPASSQKTTAILNGVRIRSHPVEYRVEEAMETVSGRLRKEDWEEMPNGGEGRSGWSRTAKVFRKSDLCRVLVAMPNQGRGKAWILDYEMDLDAYRGYDWESFDPLTFLSEGAEPVPGIPQPAKSRRLFSMRQQDGTALASFLYDSGEVLEKYKNYLKIMQTMGWRPVSFGSMGTDNVQLMRKQDAWCVVTHAPVAIPGHGVRQQLMVVRYGD